MDSASEPHRLITADLNGPGLATGFQGDSFIQADVSCQPPSTLGCAKNSWRPSSFLTSRSLRWLGALFWLAPDIPGQQG